MKAVLEVQENKNHMGYFKELAQRGHEYLEQLEEARKMFILANNQKQRELYEEKSTETSPKKENDGNPE